MGEDAGLAGAGAGEDEDGAVGGRDGAGLLGVEASQDLALARDGLGLRPAAGRVGVRARLGVAELRARGLAEPGRLLGRRRVRQLDEGGPGRLRRRLERGLRDAFRRRGGARLRAEWDSPAHCRSGPHRGITAGPPGIGRPARRGRAGRIVRAGATALYWTSSAGGAEMSSDSSHFEKLRVRVTSPSSAAAMSKVRRDRVERVLLDEDGQGDGRAAQAGGLGDERAELVGRQVDLDLVARLGAARGVVELLRSDLGLLEPLLEVLEALLRVGGVDREPEPDVLLFWYLSPVMDVRV